jgi:beta-phosphoglucomutase
VSCFEIYAKEGERWDISLNDLLRRSELKPTKAMINRIFRERQKIFRRYFKCFIFQGAWEYVRCLKAKGYSLGLVSGTPLPEIKKILPKSLFSLFDVIVSGDQVKKGKPHPEPYLKAARDLKVRPNECIVIENAPFGIESAKKAGMYCIALATSLPQAYLKKADMTVNALHEITGLIEKSCPA